MLGPSISHPVFFILSKKMDAANVHLRRETYPFALAIDTRKLKGRGREILAEKIGYSQRRVNAIQCFQTLFLALKRCFKT